MTEICYEICRKIICNFMQIRDFLNFKQSLKEKVLYFQDGFGIITNNHTSTAQGLYNCMQFSKEDMTYET